MSEVDTLEKYLAKRRLKIEDPVGAMLVEVTKLGEQKDVAFEAATKAADATTISPGWLNFFQLQSNLVMKQYELISAMQHEISALFAETQGKQQ